MVDHRPRCAQAGHTVVAVDATGRRLPRRPSRTTPDGHLELLRWARRWRERTWALEDCRHLTRRLEVDLLRVGEAVVRVPPKLMAGARRSNREPGKSDPIDALVGRPGRPSRAGPAEGPARRAERELRLLVDHREDLVVDRTRHQAAPALVPRRARGRRAAAPLARPARRPRSARGRTRPADRAVARFARDLAGPDPRADARGQRASSGRSNAGRRTVAPSLLALAGCGHLTAAKLVGQTAGIGRFRSRAAFARHNGTAPVPVWSGNTRRHRLNRGGDRQLNVALHRIAITQLQRPGPGKDYLAKRMAAGDTKTEAIRALRRRISDEVFRRIMPTRPRRQLPLAAAA